MSGTGFTTETEGERTERASETRIKKPREILELEDEFIAIAGGGNPPAELWEKRLRRKDKKVGSQLCNLNLILSNDREFSEVIAYDTFAQQVVARRDSVCGPAGPWSDAHDRQLCIWLQMSKYDYSLGTEPVSEAVIAVAEKRRFHPVKDYLNGLVWDGVPRVDTWLMNYMGIEDSQHARATGGAWLRSAVARIAKPGCQADSLLVLIGERGGEGKSSSMRALFQPWFLETPIYMSRPNEAGIAIQGYWCWEASELEGMTSTKIEAVKAWVSRREDRVRLNYNRYYQSFPRQCVGVATCNDAAGLHGHVGGNRRWYMHNVKYGSVRIDELIRDRDQLWAEACDQWVQGVPWWVVGEDQLTVEREATELSMSEPWIPMLYEWAKVQGTKVQGLSTSEALDRVGVPLDRRTSNDVKRVAAALRACGLERKKVRVGTKTPWVFVAKETEKQANGSP